MTAQPNPTSTTQALDHERQLQKAKQYLFYRFALDDQRKYYNKNVTNHKKAAAGVNLLRATCALATIAVTAIATFIIQTRFNSTPSCAGVVAVLGDECGNLNVLVNVLLVLAVTFPALGAFFNMLADLYQWKRLVKFYDEASKALEKADANSPAEEEIDLAKYRAGVMLMASGTLKVMRDEAGQWGQLIRPIEEIQRFEDASRKYYDDLVQKYNPKPPAENVPTVVKPPKPEDAQPNNGGQPQ